MYNLRYSTNLWKIYCWFSQQIGKLRTLRNIHSNIVYVVLLEKLERKVPTFGKDLLRPPSGFQ
jgi:hypothetical protein